MALTGVAQLAGYCDTGQNVTTSIPGQGTGLGFGLGPSQGMYKRQPISVSLSHWAH